MVPLLGPICGVVNLVMCIALFEGLGGMRTAADELTFLRLHSKTPMPAAQGKISNERRLGERRQAVCEVQRI